MRSRPGEHVLAPRSRRDQDGQSTTVAAREDVAQTGSGSWLRAVPLAVGVLVGVLVAGALLRVATFLLYPPAVANVTDEIGYFWSLDIGLFNDPIHPAGYSAFLLAVSKVTDELTVTIALQHALGLVAAIALYALARRANVPRLVAVVPAAVLALSGDQLYFEHALLSEALFLGILVFAAYLAVRSLDASRPELLAAGAGLLAASAALVRTVGIALLGVFLLWFLFASPRPWSRRLRVVAAAAIGVALPLSLYSVAQHRETGVYTLSRSTGWAFYSRVAPFADCTEFEPPSGTAMLCENEVPPPQRYGPDWYGWHGGPGREAFQYAPNGNATLERFARAVIINQPVDYAKYVTKDLVRYVSPDFGYDRPYSGSPPGDFQFGRRAPGLETSIEQSVARYYEPTDLEPESTDFLPTYQRIVRPHGGVLLALGLAGALGLFFAAGRARAVAVLCYAIGVVLLAMPVLTAVYAARFAVPAVPFLTVAAAIGVFAFYARVRRRGEGAPA